MLNFIYSWFGYRNLKAGFLCDFLIKRLSLLLMNILFIMFGWFFADKYIIEYLSFRLPEFFTQKLGFLSYFFFFSYLRFLNFFFIFFFLFSITYFIIFF